MIMLVIGVCCCCVLSSGGILALYFMNDDFKEWVDDNLLNKGGNNGGYDGPGASVYEHTWFAGNSKDYGVGDHKLSSDGWDKKISSLKIPDGLKVILYENADFTGKQVTLDANGFGHNDLNHWKFDDSTYGGWGNNVCGQGSGCWNDRANSMKVQKV
jgi:hypothetical protein